MRDDTHNKKDQDITISVPESNIKVSATVRRGYPMVIFSHGFGVKRDSRGMFTDIAESLPASWGYILFDYNQIDGDDVRLSSYTLQQDMLDAVLQYASENIEIVYLIGHSMGSITACMLASNIPKKVILLAPPVHGPRPLGNNSWAERPGAYYDGSTLIVPRKDGTTSIIPKAFFEEASQVDCIKVIQNYSAKTDSTVIQALDEDIIKPTDGYELLANSGVSVTEIPGNHNFDPPHRQGLIKEILAILGK